MPREIIDMGLEVGKHVLPVNKSPFPPLNTTDHQTQISVSRYDIDMNSHANNVRYLEWMTGDLPGDFVERKKCFDIKIQYHKEAVAGSILQLKTNILEENSFLHNIANENGELLAEGISRWRKQEG